MRDDTGHRESSNFSSHRGPETATLKSNLSPDLTGWRGLCRDRKGDAPPQGFDTVRRMPEPGDLSYLTRAESHKPFVVLDSDGTSVKVVDLDKEGEEKNYGIYNIEYIAIINVE